MTTVDVSVQAKVAEAPKGATAQLEEQAGDARKTIAWFIILCATIWVWTLSAPSAFARGVPENLADLNDAYSPAVVNISTTKRVSPTEGRTVERGTEEGPFNDLFEDFFKKPEGGAQTTATQGSGFIIDASGIVVTNNHVIDEATEIEVILTDGTKLQAEVIGRDEKQILPFFRFSPAWNCQPFSLLIVIQPVLVTGSWRSEIPLVWAAA